MSISVHGRPSIRWLALVLALLLAAALVYVFLPFFLEDLNRKALEAGFSVALGREVHLEGPIDLEFSLSPTLVLEDFRIANPPWASRPDFIRANRLEAQISLAGVLRRQAVIEKIFLDGVDLLLEDGPSRSNNWTFGTDPKPALSPNEESPIPVTLSKKGFIAVQRVSISYKASSSDAPFQMTIIEGSTVAVDDRRRKFSIRWTFQDVLFTTELTGGKIVDLRLLTKPWPIDGVVSTAGTSLFVKGSLMGKEGALSLDGIMTLQGDHLSSLNPLLGTDLPSLGPYELAGALHVSNNDYSLKNIRAKIGQSDFAGDVTFGTKDNRQWLSATLESNTFQIEDFRTPESALKRVGTDPPVESFAIPAETLRTMDTDIELSVNTLLHHDKNLGAVSLSATLQDGLLSLARFKAESFGGTVSAKGALDVRNPAPTATFEAKAKSIDYGQILNVFGITDEVEGSTDFDLTLSGKGSTLHELLEHVALQMNAGPTTLTVGKKKSSDQLPIGLRQATLTVSEGGP
ncbi:MAG: AsmA family protein, partial [Candidatus Binatia bacterium]